MNELRVLDLFSGIGGFSLGLERTGGFRTVAFCEIEPFCQRVLRKHWPGVPIYDDVRELTAERLRADGIAVDVVTGGFPCQDLSVAGRRAGIEGERSGLWTDLCRIIGDVRPRYAIVENVPGLLSGPSEQRGGWFGRVLGDLAEIGFDAEWHCISAAHVGGPHIRDRVWLVTYPGQIIRTDTGKRSDQKGREEQAGSSRLSYGYVDSMVRDLFARTRRDRWRTQSAVARTCDDVPGRLDRVCALGNAVVPQIPELIGRAILEAEGA